MKPYLYLFGLLFFFFNVPQTTAIKNTLGFLLLLSSLFVIHRQKNLIIDNFSFVESSNVFLSLIFLSIYILLNSLFFAWEPIWSLGEFKSHWLYPVIYFFSGATLVFSLSRRPNYGNRLLSFIFIFLTIHIVIGVTKFLLDSFSSGVILFRVGGFIGAELTSYIANIIQAFILGELLYRFIKGKKYMIFSSRLIILIFFLVTLTTFFTAVRNSIVIFSLLLLLSVILILFLNKFSSTKKKNSPLILLSIILIVSMAASSIFYDKRWISLVETINIAIDTKNNKAWLDKDKYPLPKLANGEEVSRSNYERIAWAYQGLKYIYSHPAVGIGFGRNIFGHAIEHEYTYLLGETAKKTRGMHSHSGIIDFTIGVGIIGAFGWFIFIFLLLKFFFLNIKKNISAPSMIGLLLSISFVARSFVDSFMRDHMFQQFMLLMGILLALSVIERKENI